MKHKQTVLCLFILLCLPGCLCAQSWSGIIAPIRAVDWSKAGVPGGIPARTTICSTLSPGVTAAQINSAIASCPSGQTVFLKPGTYSLSSGIDFTAHSGITLRGAGANQTLLVFTGDGGCQGTQADICLASADVNYWGSPSNTANWTASYAAGTTSITLSSKTNLAVGTPITLDQTDDTTDSGDIFVCYTPQGVCSTNGDNGGFLRSGRSQEQIVTVTSISGSGPYTIGISPGIYMPNWTSAKTPQAWWPTSPISASGVENLSIDNASSGSLEGVSLFNCNGCWVKGIRSVATGRSHVMLWQSPHSTVQDSYFFGTANQSSSSYGVEGNNASDSLVQNNIFQEIAGPEMMNGNCSGCVWAYNFDINNLYNPYTWQMQGIYPHTAGADHVLIEGNQGAGLYSDNFHGTHQFQTLFRNVYNGFQPNNGTTTNSGLGALQINAFSRFYNIIGNVLGNAVFTHYESNLNNSYPANSAIVNVGGGDEVPNDPNVGRTLMMWGNYDTATAAVRWCGNSSDPGWSTTCAITSEVPSGIANYANPVPSSTSLPPSFYYSSTPNWWPTGKPWPPIGPDVAGGNLAGYAGHAYSIPAADCYAKVMSGPSNGTGPVLSFNAQTCYVPTSGPAPPTNLTAVPH